MRFRLTGSDPFVKNRVAGGRYHASTLSLPMTTPILLVEDDADLANLLALHLRDQGYDVDRAATGPEGLDKGLHRPYSLIVLDVMLPGGLDGLKLCRTLRAHDIRTPVLMLTAKSDEIDKVMGLEGGADDYVTKPFSVREVLARILALLRRRRLDGVEEDEAAGEPLVRGPLYLNPRTRTATLRDQAVTLTAKEFDLLLLFARHPGRVFSRQDLLDRVWGYQYDGYSHTVNSHINRLRAKIEADPARPELIQTVWGVGYRLGVE